MDEEESDYHRHNSEEEIEWTWGEPDVGGAQREGGMRGDVQTPHQAGPVRAASATSKEAMLRAIPTTKDSSHHIAQFGPFMRTEVSSSVKEEDKELTKIQSFILDFLTSLTALLEQGRDMSPDKVRDATSVAV